MAQEAKLISFRAGITPRTGLLVAPNYDAMSWGATQHEHHELLFRLRAVENDRWVVRAASSGRSEAISPHGEPSAAGIEIGQTGTAVVNYGHRDTQPLGSLGYLLGPAAAAATLLLLTAHAIRKRREQGPRGPRPTNVEEPKFNDPAG